MGYYVRCSTIDLGHFTVVFGKFLLQRFDYTKIYISSNIVYVLHGNMTLKEDIMYLAAVEQHFYAAYRSFVCDVTLC